MSEPLQAQASRGVSPAALLVAGAFFMEFLDGTVIATALPDMAKTFGVEAVDLNIGISAYLITSPYSSPPAVGLRIASAPELSSVLRWLSSPSPPFSAG